MAGSHGMSQKLCICFRSYFRRGFSSSSLKGIHPKGKSKIHGISNEELAKYAMVKTNPQIDIGSIYTNKPHLQKTYVGEKIKPRVIWNELDCSNGFPSSPEDVQLDLKSYLEQKDIWERRKTLSFQKFCVGSILAVTRANMYSPDGYSRFVGLCVYIDRENENNKRANFILRNVLDNEPLEILHRTYSPVIQKIEVLRHEKWENEHPENGLLFLRDFPPEYSFVDQSMTPEEYTDEPSIRQWTEVDKENIKAWFDAIFESRRRPQKQT